MNEGELLFELKCLQRSKARKRFRKDIFEFWEACAYCGTKNPSTLDHVIAKSRGGSTTRSNLVASCACCNLNKSDMSWFSWFRAQDFWSEERELKILAWLHQNSNEVESARVYTTLCATPLFDPCESLSA